MKLIYLIFIHSTCKFEKHKQSFPSENYEHTFSNKKHKQSFPSENYAHTFSNKNHKPSSAHEKQIFFP